MDSRAANELSRSFKLVEGANYFCACLAKCLDSVINVKALVGAFNQEKALVGAFSVIVKPMDRFTALILS